MPQENVELGYRANRAFNRRDIDEFLALCDPDVELFAGIAALEGGGPYRGRDGVRSWYEKVLEVAPDFSVEIEEVRSPRSDDVLAGAPSGSRRREQRSH